MSYADEVYEQWKNENPLVARSTPRRINEGHAIAVPKIVAPVPDQTVYSIPEEVFAHSIGHYERNQFARLLHQHFGCTVADELLQRFQIGTSARWPGSCVFWYIDEDGRKRGGQIKLFGDDWHTEKYIDRDGKKQPKTSWVNSALVRRLQAKQLPIPEWLATYERHAQRSPCLFGLPQLLTQPADKPVAIVEAPKTAVVCSAYFPRFIWLAIGSLSYLTTHTTMGMSRLAPLRYRKIAFFPDLSIQGSALARWSRTADELRELGYVVTVSDYLEKRATDEERKAGLDLADYLLGQWKGYPPDWDMPAIQPRPG